MSRYISEDERLTELVTSLFITILCFAYVCISIFRESRSAEWNIDTVQLVYTTSFVFAIAGMLVFWLFTLISSYRYYEESSDGTGLLFSAIAAPFVYFATVHGLLTNGFIKSLFSYQTLKLLTDFFKV